MRWTGQGTHDGNLAGMPPTGKQVSVEALTLFRLAGDKIVEMWDWWDALGCSSSLAWFPEWGKPNASISCVVFVDKEKNSAVSPARFVLYMERKRVIPTFSAFRPSASQVPLLLPHCSSWADHLCASEQHQSPQLLVQAHTQAQALVSSASTVQRSDRYPVQRCRTG